VLAVGLEDRPIFASPKDACKPFDNVRKALIRAGQESGVGHVTLHMLRHSFCTQSADAGVPAFVLQEQMGHRNLSTTQRYYHASRQSKRIATETLERARDEIKQLVNSQRI
jgi:integrase